MFMSLEYQTFKKETISIQLRNLGSSFTFCTCCIVVVVLCVLLLVVSCILL